MGARRRKLVPEDYVSLTPADLKRLAEARDTLDEILGHPITPMTPLVILARLQQVDDTIRRMTRDAFWRAF